MPHQKNSSVGLWCLLGIAIALALGMAGMLLLGAGGDPPALQKPQEPQEEGAVQVFYADTKEGRLPAFADAEEEGDQENFLYRLCARPVFPKGTKAGNVLFENTPGNAYPMEVIYWLDDTGQAVYRSGLLEPGTHLAQDALVVPLEKGDYPATAEITVYRQAGGEVLCVFSEAVTLVVER